MFNNLIGKSKKTFEKLPILLFLFKNKFFKNKSSKKIKLLDYKISIQDFISFYYEVIYIFKDEIYFFSTDKKDPLIIDGGVCIGTSLFYFKNKYPESRIIGFEPDEEAFKIAEKNIKENDLLNIELHNSGLYDHSGELSFSKTNIDAGKIDGSGEIKINVIKLSEYIKEPVDFLKLNIEGAEYQVLKDLDENKKIKEIDSICFEWHSFRNQTQNLGEILEILKKNNFKYFISSLSTSNFGKFKAKKGTEFFLMIYAKQIN